ncbi:MAG: FMN-binding glutamate synthase family protein [Thermoplasmata archaeon]|nr:FMN-binding glutamate synthase family protein [Thermoplasmata archaeon]
MPGRPGPEPAGDEWYARSIAHVRQAREIGRAPMRGFGMLRPHPTLDDVVITPAQAARLPVDAVRTLVGTRVVIGEGRARPLVLERPFYVAPMSLGALTPAARLVLAEAAAEFGMGFDTGQGGLSQAERKTLAKGARTITQVASGRYGVDRDYIRAADAVEISIGNGAKPGMGGMLFAEKITKEIAEIRALPKGADALSPPRHLDIDSPEDIRLVVETVREVTEWEVPVLLQFAAGDLVADIKIAVDAGVDAIVVDASETIGTAVPSLVGDESGTPLIGVFGGVRRALQLAGVTRGGPKVLVNGGMMTASDVFKALAMGASAVGMDLPFLVSMGCLNCFDHCVRGECPAGLAGAEKRFNEGNALKWVRNYVRATDQELRMFIALTGHHDVSEITIEDVRAMTYDAATITGIKLMGYERVLPMWQH